MDIQQYITPIIQDLIYHVCANIELFLQKIILTIEILQIMCYNQFIKRDIV